MIIEWFDGLQYLQIYFYFWLSFLVSQLTKYNQLD